MLNHRYHGDLMSAIRVLRYAQTIGQRFDNVILCIWHYKDMQPVTIGQNKKLKCKHWGVEVNSTCKYCGAWYGFLGQERHPNELKSHLFLFLNEVQGLTDTVYIKAQWPVDMAYKYGTGVKALNYYRASQHVLCSKYHASSARDQFDHRDRVLSVFSNLRKAQIKAQAIIHPSMCVYDLINNYKTLIVNPDFSEAVRPNNKFYVIHSPAVAEKISNLSSRIFVSTETFR